MSDEIYARMCYDGVPHASLTAYPELEDRLILLDGWSKTYAMTGWRLGWGVWPEPLVEHATRLAINIHSCVNAATQWAGIAALTGPQDAVDQHGGDLRRAPSDRSSTALNDLPGFRCATPGGAFYAFPNIEGTGRSSRELERGAARARPASRPSAAPASASIGEGYLRFSYAASTEAIQEACKRIGATPRRLRPRGELAAHQTVADPA